MTYQEAKKKARYGHRDWVAYTTREGEPVYAPASAKTVKDAMLATGCNRSWTLICANDGVAMKMNWPIAMNVYRQFRMGWR